MGVTAQKGQAFAPLRRGGLRHAVHYPGAGCRGGAAQGFRLDQPALHGAVAEGEIHHPDRFQFFAAGAGHAGSGLLVGLAGQARGPQLAQFA